MKRATAHDLQIEDLRAEVAALKEEIAKRDQAKGVAREWVETLRRADKEAINAQQLVIEGLRKDATVSQAALAASENYVVACLAIRATRYPSEDFTRACTKATSCYRALVEVWEKGSDHER